MKDEEAIDERGRHICLRTPTKRTKDKDQQRTFLFYFIFFISGVHILNFVCKVSLAGIEFIFRFIIKCLILCA